MKLQPRPKLTNRSIMMPDDLWSWLSKRSEHSLRSVSAEIIYILRRAKEEEAKN